MVVDRALPNQFRSTGESLCAALIGSDGTPASAMTLTHPAESQPMGNDTRPTEAIRPMTAADWPAVQAIYAFGIATGDATFETEPPTWERFDATRLTGHRFVATDAAA